MLGAFTRCFVGVERLLAISRLDKTAQKDGHEEGRWALLWMACGTIRELLKAVDALNRAGVKRHLTGDALVSWREVRNMFARWQREPIYTRVRNSLAFHFDERGELFNVGLEVVAAWRVPLYLSEGHAGKVRRFPFAQEVLLAGLFSDVEKRGEEFEHFQKGVRYAQARSGALLYRVFVETLKAAAPGLSPLQQTRARLLRVLEKRRVALVWDSIENEDLSKGDRGSPARCASVSS